MIGCHEIAGRLNDVLRDPLRLVVGLRIDPLQQSVRSPLDADAVRGQIRQEKVETVGLGAIRDVGRAGDVDVQTENRRRRSDRAVRHPDPDEAPRKVIGAGVGVACRAGVHRVGIEPAAVEHLTAAERGESDQSENSAVEAHQILPPGVALVPDDLATNNSAQMSLSPSVPL